jgi:hypothetical protein
MQPCDPGALDDAAVWRVTCGEPAVLPVPASAADQPCVDDTVRGVPFAVRALTRKVIDLCLKLHVC